MGSEYQLLSSTVSCTSLLKEMSECFICRDGELISSNPLRNFCDCKNLLAHHVCLSTWIQRGCGCADRLQCIICKAKYQLRRRSPWRSLAVQWQTWLALITTIILMGALPYVVHCMMTAFPNNRSHITFKLAAGTFGFLSELLLIKGLSSWLVTRYHKALQTSFIIHPRIPDPQEKEKDADLRNGHLISF